MFSITVDVYVKLFELYTKVFEEKKALMGENKDLKKRVADLEKRLATKENKLFLLDDEGTPIKSFTLTGKLTVMKEPTEEKLEAGKWYHTTDFSKEELEKLLPVGTKVEVEQEVYYPNINRRSPVNTVFKEVKEIVYGIPNGKTYVSIQSDFYKEWFKIIKEK